MDDEKVITDKAAKDNKEIELTAFQQKDNKIKELKQEKKNLKEQLSKSVDKEELTTLKQEVQRMKVERTYGADNLEEAIKLVNAGFEETRIKEMLNKNVGAGKFDITPEELGLEKDTGKEPDKKEDEDEDIFAKAKAENKKHQLF